LVTQDDSFVHELGYPNVPAVVLEYSKQACELEVLAGTSTQDCEPATFPTEVESPVVLQAREMLPFTATVVHQLKEARPEAEVDRETDGATLTLPVLHEMEHAPADVEGVTTLHRRTSTSVPQVCAVAVVYVVDVLPGISTEVIMPLTEATRRPVDVLW
jgi:hypothetical protein